MFADAFCEQIGSKMIGYHQMALQIPLVGIEHLQVAHQIFLMDMDRHQVASRILLIGIEFFDERFSIP